MDTASRAPVDQPPAHPAWADAPSPCIDVCKYKRQGRCIGCSMTKAEKAAFPHSGGAEAKKAFVADLMDRLRGMGRDPAFWALAYKRKCEREGVTCPLDVEEA